MIYAILIIIIYSNSDWSDRENNIPPTAALLLLSLWM